MAKSRRPDSEDDDITEQAVDTNFFVTMKGAKVSLSQYFNSLGLFVIIYN